MDMILADLSFDIFDLLHFCKFFQDFSDILFDFAVQDLPTIFWNKHDMIRAIPPGVLYTFVIQLDTSLL